jgi:signal transduction histidine kinase
MQSMIQSRTEGKTITKQFRVLGSLKGKTNSGIFRFTSTPFQFDENFYYLVTLEDISHEIRKAELEQIFFHDMMNSIGGLHGVIDLLKRNEDVEPLYIDILEASYNTMYDTIREQKQYSQAESGQLTVKKELLHTQDITIETTLPFKEKNTGKGSVEIHTETVDLLFTSDSALLSRVLINMIKNAVEASSGKDVVTVGAAIRDGSEIKRGAANSHEAAIKEGTVNRHGTAIMDGTAFNGEAVTRDEKLRFWVHNPGFIPKETQLQIFERSFTTKGRGRGLGTFSMKLLGEHYLGGKVGFSSDKKEGTTFWIDLPLER